MKRRIISFLFIVFLISQNIHSQNIKQLHLTGSAQKLSDELIARKDQNGNYCAAIQVISDMDGFSYDSNDGIVGSIVDNPGKDIVYLTSTERVLEIYKSGYQPLKIILAEIGISLKPGEIWQIAISGEKEQTKLPVTISVDPADAIVIIDGIPATEVPQMLDVGTHHLLITKDGFESIDKQIVVDEQHVFFQEQLLLVKKVLVQIESNPVGAVVYFDDIKIGETPVSVFYMPGNYQLKIAKEGFITLEGETLSIVSPLTSKTYTLEENAGYITINTNAAATVYLNGEQVYKPVRVKLVPQLIKIKVTQPKAETLEKEVTVKRNDDLVLDMYPILQTGTLQIAVTPFDSKIVLIGDAGEHYSSTGSGNFENIPVGTYSIKVSSAGFQDHKETVVLTRGEVKDLSIKLSVEDKKPEQVATKQMGTNTENRYTYKTPHKKSSYRKTTLGPGVAITIPSVKIEDDSLCNGYAVGYKIGLRGEFFRNKIFFPAIEINYEFSPLQIIYKDSEAQFYACKLQYLDFEAIGCFVNCIEVGYAYKSLIGSTLESDQTIKTSGQELITGVFYHGNAGKSKNESGAAFGLRFSWGLEDVLGMDRVGKISVCSIWLGYQF
jgi:hypothetical protein